MKCHSVNCRSVNCRSVNWVSVNCRDTHCPSESASLTDSLAVLQERGVCFARYGVSL